MWRRLRDLPTRWQIALLQAMILTLVLGGVGETVLIQQRHDLGQRVSDQLATDIAQQTNGIVDKFGIADLSGSALANDAKLQSFLRDLPSALASRQTGAAVFQPDGIPLGTATVGPPAPAPPAAVIAAASAGHMATFQATVRGKPVVAVAAPIQAKGETLAIVVLSALHQPIDDQLARLRLAFLIGWAVAVALASGLSLLASRRVLRPLDRLVRVTGRIARGDLSQRVELPPGHNELAQVGAAFDAMIARLETTFEAQHRFVADAAHELRTPLTALSASTELLLIGADEADPATTQRLLRHLDRELNRLIRLTNNLLTLSGVDAAVSFAMQPTDLSAVVSEVGEQAREMLDGQDLRLDVAPALWANANADALRQVLLNLLDNAHKYTPASGTISLRAAAADGQVRVTVEDTGIGIPLAAQAHLFQRFYRVDTTRARQSGGTGLGLAIVDALVRAQGGQVILDSAPDAGTRVAIHLPRLRP